MKNKKRGLTSQGWYTSGIAGRVFWQSSYERKFIEWLDSQEIGWIKCKERFLYVASDGKEHKYNPDFYLTEPKLYIEVKGMVRMNDPAKFTYFPENKQIVLLGYQELKKLGLDVKDPMENRPILVPGQWPYDLLKQMPDFSQIGTLTKELKQKVDSNKFFRFLSSKNICYETSD